MVVFNTFTVPEDGIVYQLGDTKAFVNDKEIGKGTLYITERLLSWCEDTKKIGFSLQYTNIALHAIRREPLSVLYMMVDHYLTIPEGLLPAGMAQPGTDRGDGDSSDDMDDGEDQCFTELMFEPSQADVLSEMFSAMNKCQALHPCPEDEDEDSDIYEDASELMDDDDDNYEPVDHPVDVAEERMQELNIGVNNGHGAQINGQAAYNAEQFEDDED